VVARLSAPDGFERADRTLDSGTATLVRGVVTSTAGVQRRWLLAGLRPGHRVDRARAEPSPAQPLRERRRPLPAPGVQVRAAQRAARRVRGDALAALGTETGMHAYIVVRRLWRS
jgi:hypothetical protein